MENSHRILPPLSTLSPLKHKRLEYKARGSLQLKSLFNVNEKEGDNFSIQSELVDTHPPTPSPSSSSSLGLNLLPHQTPSNFPHQTPMLSFQPQLPFIQTQPTQPTTIVPNTTFILPNGYSYQTPLFSQIPFTFNVYPSILANQESQVVQSNARLPQLPTSSSYETLSHYSTQTKCALPNCLLCRKGPPVCLARSPTWILMLRVVLFCLSNSEQGTLPSFTRYFSLKGDIYDFIIAHWHLLCGSKKYKGRSWHKQVQDILSHTKEVFESGVGTFEQKGFWRLKISDDPWNIHSIYVPKRKSNSLSVSSDTYLRTSSSSSSSPSTLRSSNHLSNNKGNGGVDINKLTSHDVQGFIKRHELLSSVNCDSDFDDPQSHPFNDAYCD